MSIILEFSVDTLLFFWSLFDYLCGMEHTTTPNPKTQTTAEAILHFSSFVICGESDKKHFLNPVVVNYALSYILRAIKENQQNPEFSAEYKEVFWYIANTYKKS